MISASSWPANSPWADKLDLVEDPGEIGLTVGANDDVALDQRFEHLPFPSGPENPLVGIRLESMPGVAALLVTNLA